MSHHRLSLSASLIYTLLCAVPLLAQDASEAAAKPQQQAKPEGQIVDGPNNIRQFRPDDTTVAVDASNINLRKVFEDLGADATLWYQHVQTLANPFFEGRAPGTRGGEIAAEYVEFFFKQYGLQPAFPAEAAGSDATSHEGRDKPGGGEGGGEANVALTSYFQPFDFAAPDPKVELVTAEASLGSHALAKDRDFVVLGVSANGTITGPVTFVGYGIEKGQDNYSSFEDDTDLTGRIALVLRYEPLNEEGHSRWADARFSRFSSIAPKFKALADRHAAGIILINPPGAVDGKSDLETLRNSARFGDRLDIPVVQMSPEAVAQLLSKADAKNGSLRSLRQAADDGSIKTLNLKDSVKVTLTANLNYDDRLHTRNIAAILPGRGSLADQWIVIGAHYDHVGYGYTGAMPDNIGKLHPGADDNASGTAGMLLAAKRLAHDYETSPGAENRRSILFMAFGGEEAGLYGSKWFVKHSSIPAKNIYCMLNMDMIGRLRSNMLLVQGTGTAKEFDEALKPLFLESGITVAKVPGGRGPSDHSSFYNAGIPVLFLFTGEHNEYHKPQDRAYTVNPAGAVKVIDLLESIALDFATRTEPLTFVTNAGGSAGGAPRNAAGGPATAPARGARVRLGIMPVYGGTRETGVEVDSVSDGTAAAEAGIKAGDVLLSWNGEELTGGQKLFEMLSKAEPGQKVKVTLQRGDKNVTVEVTLKAAEGQ